MRCEAGCCGRPETVKVRVAHSPRPSAPGSMTSAPPWAAATRAAMVRPRPTPRRSWPTPGVRASSSRTKGSRTRTRDSSGMPGPASATESASVSPVRRARRTMGGAPYLAAFSTRFHRARRRRTGSALTEPAPSASTRRSLSAVTGSCAARVATPPRSSATSTSSGRRGKVPVSRRAAVRTSSIRPSSSSMSAMTSAKRVSVSVVRGRSSSATRMRASGERSSCDTLARSSRCPRTRVSMRPAMSFQASPSSSISSRPRRRPGRRWKPWRSRCRRMCSHKGGSTTRVSRSPAPKRRLASVRSSMGRAMRRTARPAPNAVMRRRMPLMIGTSGPMRGTTRATRTATIDQMPTTPSIQAICRPIRRRKRKGYAPSRAST